MYNTTLHVKQVLKELEEPNVTMYRSLCLVFISTVKRKCRICKHTLDTISSSNFSHCRERERENTQADYIGVFTHHKMFCK